MILYIINHTYKYETEKICRIYFPTDKIVFCESFENNDSSQNYVYTEIAEDSEKITFICKALYNNESFSYSFSEKNTGKTDDWLKERLLAKAMVKLLSDITKIVPLWGILTGVRPAKLMRTYINELGTKKAVEEFQDFLQVSKEKTQLALSVAEYENTCIALSEKNSYSLYISIPFCPTRCSYCSFVSHSIEKAKKLIPDYVKKLCEEIKQTSILAEELNLKLETVYIGGGTPTSFSASDLETITNALNKYFDMKNVKEFTVEAGRPDTIDAQKLTVLKNAGVTRISINPQTFSNSVLQAIGRKHSAEDTIEKYNLARSIGFDNINMDFIAGLPTDTAESFKHSIDEAIRLSPENITVHTLALKKAASIVTKNDVTDICKSTEEMVNYANEMLYKHGYFPYYMYRQSKSVGNLENVGWCKKDKPCLYNIYMMEEIHTVLACGAAAVTKLKSDNKIDRVYNYKYPYEYINDFDEMLSRKEEIRRFYNNGDNASPNGIKI